MATDDLETVFPSIEHIADDDLRACLVRNLLRPIDFVLFYLVGVVMITLTERRQRLGDLAAKTEVRRAR